MTNQPEKKQLTASQRIDNLENAVMGMYQTVDNMARDLLTLKSAVQLLDNKLSAVVKASNQGEALTNDVLDRLMQQNNAESLKSKVDAFVAQGILVPAESVKQNSFLVGRELAEDGTVVNMRIQFVVASAQKEAQDKLVGAKVGDVVSFEEGKPKLEVLEVFDVHTPTASDVPAEVDAAGPTEPAATA